VVGASVATTTGRSAAVLVQLYLLFSGYSRVQVKARHLRLVPGVMWTLCRLSATGLLQILISTTSYIGLVRVISMFGSPAVAGFTIGLRTVLFALLPSWGLSNAAATMVGQALGAGKPDRAESAVWTACRYNLAFLGVIGFVFVAFAPWLVAIYTNDPAIAEYAVACLRIVSFGFVFYAYGMVLTQSFNGAGDTMTPTLINILCLWLGELPLAYLLATGAGFGPSGVFWAIAIAFSAMSFVSAAVFRRGKWKSHKV